MPPKPSSGPTSTASKPPTRASSPKPKPFPKFPTTKPPSSPTSAPKSSIRTRLRPVTAAGVPVWIRNSFKPENPGTKITAKGDSSGGGVKALTAIKDVTMITVGGPGIVGLTDVLARSFAATAATRTNVFLVSQSSSQNDICFVIATADEKRALAALREAFAPEIAEQTVEHVNTNPDVAIVAAVGENMKGIPGVAGRIFTALGHENVNIMAIAQGSSEYNISLVVEKSAMQRALTSLHHEFRLSEFLVAK